MNKVAVHPNSSYRDSPPSTLPHLRPAVMERGQMNKQPSRLQMLQADYQERLMREKEEKMIRMYEDQQKRALGKVNQRVNSGSSSNGVSAREFFQQRRTLEQKGYQSPPIEEHYRQMRRGYSSGGHSSASSQASSRYGKNSAGKDRSNLLQPIEKKSPPVPTKPRMARQRPNNAMQARNNANRAQNPNGNYDVRKDNSRTSSNDSSPPPNLQTLRNFQRKRLGAPPPPKDENEGPQKLTDFQRWQMEQNKAREQRLDKHRQSVGGRSSQGQQWGDGDSDGDKENLQDELEEKQREVQAEIEKHKHELENMRRQKEQEEEQERRAAEAEKKREAEREKKRRQQAAEERKRRMEEEERERKEEEKQRREEEKQRREEEKKRQMYEQKKRQQQRRAPPPKPRTPPPAEDDYVLPDSNVDFFLQAAMAEESQGGGGVRLVPCKVCGRKFANDRLAKHQAACKNANKKRKVFDPTKMRTEGTEMAKYVGKSKTPRKEPKKKDWRAQHESFIETIRYAKKVSEMEASGVKPQNLPPPPKTVNPDYVRCPTCNRNFNPSTAERHIPNCRARPRR